MTETSQSEALEKITQGVCARAFKHYGMANQLNQLQEECGELVAAVSHLRRDRAEAHSGLVSELVDVMIMVRQLRIAVGPEVFDIELLRKLSRLEGRITAEEQNQAGEAK